MLPAQVIDRYPCIYHVAGAGTWPSIQRRGLLSTSAALDALGITGERREAIEGGHRPAMLSLHPGAPDDIVLRDQKPMPPSRLARALPADISAEHWYRLINAKVFFWVSPERLGRLLRSYGDQPHDVLRVDTACLLGVHAAQVSLCHMNSGNTLPFPLRRDPSIFRRISDYPVRRSGAPVKEVVELVVDYAVPDIARHVLDVTRMQGDQRLESTWRSTTTSPQR